MNVVCLKSSCGTSWRNASLLDIITTRVPLVDLYSRVMTAFLVSGRPTHFESFFDDTPEVPAGTWKNASSVGTSLLLSVSSTLDGADSLLATGNKDAS